MIKGKKIILGITGSIAAYKAAYLTRLFVKEGAEVQVMMTESAKEFITPLTLSTLSKNPVISSFTKGTEGEWHNHVKLANWADMIIIAPATAQIIAKMANGICDSVLLAVYQSAACTVFVAPAMDQEMYRHPANRENLRKLEQYGNIIIPAAEGELASGLVGSGRMEEPENILAFIKKKITENLPLAGRKALVTAGPTREALDAVRFISNRSSGKMGYAIAEVLVKKGADVKIISGPVTPGFHNGFDVEHVNTAAEMAEACLKQYKDYEIVIMAAAVSDYAPASSVSNKIKKSADKISVELNKTIDILAEMGNKKKPGQILIGFALETDNELENARIKKRNKNLDIVVLNSLSDEGAGFETDTNKITIIDSRDRITNFEIKSKKDVAKDIVGKIIQDYYS